MMGYSWEGIFSDFFLFLPHFFSTDFTPIYFLFFYLSHFRGCEDDLYISTQQIDGWADTLKTFNKTPMDDPFTLLSKLFFVNKPLMTIFNHLISSVVV